MLWRMPWRCETVSVQCVLLKWMLFIIFLLEYSNQGAGFLIIPKKTEQNQTKIFDRDKLTAKPNAVEFINKNSISDSSKVLSDFKKVDSDNKTKTMSEESHNDTVSKTIFKTENLTTIIAQVGSTVQIPCSVQNIGEGTVSWIRKKDYHLLTVGLTTYSSDERYGSIHSEESEDWELEIKYVQLRDLGLYECQVSTHPPISIFIQLNVVEARAEISGAPEKYLKPGSMLRLTCRVQESVENPLYIFWYHNSRMINYDAHRGVNVSTEADNKYSELVILQTTISHSGNYSCVPNSAAPASSFVHIFNGENPAAMQHGDDGSTIVPSTYVKLFLLAQLAYQLIHTALTT